MVNECLNILKPNSFSHVKQAQFSFGLPFLRDDQCLYVNMFIILNTVTASLQKTTQFIWIAFTMSL